MCDNGESFLPATVPTPSKLARRTRVPEWDYLWPAALDLFDYHVDGRRRETRAIRNPRANRRWRHGRSVRAKDTKLKREVAVKVLPDSFAADPERMARFQREAEVLASLNHPNIAAIYGVEERALVMELVPGGPLTGPLPAETALNYARQIADALEAAHDKGIVHRDLKPANIMITPAGVVKLLDFGLAAVPISGESASDPTHSPTLTIAATRAGMIMGTAAYMSPEQAAGKPVDKRADIWAYGVVLWEMLSGERLFDGETISHTLADVLRAPIDFDKLPQETPLAIRDLLRRCLDRNVKNRLRDIGEARVAIQNVGKEPEVPAQVSTVAALRFPWIPWSAAALFLFLALVISFLYLRQTPGANITYNQYGPNSNSALHYMLQSLLSLLGSSWYHIPFTLVGYGTPLPGL
jgi:serine/threonine protein kinase